MAQLAVCEVQSLHGMSLPPKGCAKNAKTNMLTAEQNTAYESGKPVIYIVFNISSSLFAVSKGFKCPQAIENKVALPDLNPQIS